MSNQFNVSLFPWPKYTNEERQPVPWLILNFLRKLLSQTCHLNKDISQGNSLNWLFSIKLFCFKMSNQFNVCYFPWSKYTNEERQPVPWLILTFLLGSFGQKHATYTRWGTKLPILYQVILLQNAKSVQCMFISMVWVYQKRAPACSLAYIKFSKEAFVRNMPFAQGNTLISCSLSSNSFSKCPISSMFLCFHGLSIPMKSASLFLGLY